MTEYDSASVHVSPCLLSDTHYARHCELVFSELSKNSKSYIRDFLTTIHNAITDKTSSPTQAFLALKLLVNASETRNKDLMSRLATSTSLLNRLFHDAQFDYDDALESKGKHYFSENPTKEVIKLGKDYIRLVLEAFVYWNKEYGSVNSDDPLNCFYAVFTSLCGKTQLPTTYKFVGKNPQVKAYVQKAPRGSVTRSPSPSLSPERSMSPERSRFSATSRDNSPKLRGNEAYSQLMKCISSQEAYERHSPVIFDLVEKPSLDYNKKLFDAVTEVLSSRSHHSYTEKFYALYLLVQITETKDKVFVTQLVRESPLLNKLYSHAKKKESDWNGSDANARRNLRDLTLEAIKFWHHEFGNANPNNPFYSFTYLYETLKKTTKFPNEYYYIGRSLEKSFDEDRKIVTRTEEVSDKNDPIMRLVKVYISSGISFRDDSSNIASILIKQSKEKSSSYLQGTLRILNSSEMTPNTKFYALYLLLKVAETKNNNFIAALAESKSLLNQLTADAMFDKNKPVEKRGPKFFSSKPSHDEAVIGSNYVQLLHETIRFLARNYGSENPRSVNNVFKTMFDKVQKETTMESRDHFAGRNLRNIEDSQMKKFEITPFHGANIEISSPKAKPKEKTTAFSLPDLDKQLNQLNYSKTVLLMFLQDNSRENQDNTELADMLIQDVINQYNNNVHPHLQHLMNSSQTKLEDYKDIIYHEGKIANELEQQLLDYKTGKATFFELKQNIIPLLASHNSPATSATSILLENRPVYEGRPSLRMGRLQNSSPGPQMRSRFSRSPAKAQSELLRPAPLTVSEGVLPEFGRGSNDNDFLDRPSRKAATAHLPLGRESPLRLRPFERPEMLFTESVTVPPPVENRPSSLQVIQPLEQQFNQALEEKFKALDSLASRSALNRPERNLEFGGLQESGLRSNRRAGTAHIPGRDGLLNIKPLDRQYTFEPTQPTPVTHTIDNRPSSLKAIDPLEQFNRTLDEKFKALDMLASRSSTANRPSTQVGYQPAQRSSFLSPSRDILDKGTYIQPSPLAMASSPKGTSSFGTERSAFLSDPLYRPQTSSLGVSGAGREPLRGFYMGKLNENTDNRGERNYLFSNSAIGNRIGM